MVSIVFCRFSLQHLVNQHIAYLELSFISPYFCSTSANFSIPTHICTNRSFSIDPASCSIGQWKGWCRLQNGYVWQYIPQMISFTSGFKGVNKVLQQRGHSNFNPFGKDCLQMYVHESLNWFLSHHSLQPFTTIDFPQDKSLAHAEQKQGAGAGLPQKIAPTPKRDKEIGQD